MKIHIRSAEKNMTILLPTRLLFSKALLKFGLGLGRRYSNAVPDISPAAVDALCDELRRIKKTRAPWQLVELRSAGGDEIQIVL